ncbi:MAG: RidA family protein [Anaerolineales bacterium]|jgi:2-iminobutanoate/2-iminopropanoate deaminase
MPKRSINPDQLFNSRQYGFSQAISTPVGRTIYCSGQVAWDENEQIVGANDLEVQTLQALKNLELLVKAAGGAMADVVSLRIYIRQEVIEQGRYVKEGLLKYFPGESPPAATWIGVGSLADENFLIEIEAVAVIEYGPE